MKTRALKFTAIEILSGHRNVSVSADSATLGLSRVRQLPLANSVDRSQTGIA